MRQQTHSSETSSLSYHWVTLHPDQQIGLHSQKTWELSYVIRGSGERIIGRSHEKFRSGEAVLVLPGMPHQWHFDGNDTDKDGNIENITISFAASLISILSNSVTEYREMMLWYEALDASLTFSITESRHISEIMRRMKTQHPHERVTSLLQLLTYIYENRRQATVVAVAENMSSKDKIQKIESFLNCNYLRKVNLDELAHYIGMNRSSLCTFFREKTGKTIFGYLIELRISIAKQFLENVELSISQCCFKSGFNDIPYFNRVFKRIVGISPKAYRASLR